MLRRYQTKGMELNWLMFCTSNELIDLSVICTNDLNMTQETKTSATIYTRGTDIMK